MQPNERIRLVPVPARRVPTVDHDDLGIGLRNQRIHERHAGGTAANDEIVRVEQTPYSHSIVAGGLEEMS